MGSGLGISEGLGYATAITHSIKYFPANKSLISGIVLCGYGISSLIFSFLCLAIVNPHNQKPTITQNDGKAQDKFYTSDVYDNVIIYIYIYIIF